MGASDFFELLLRILSRNSPFYRRRSPKLSYLGGWFAWQRREISRFGKERRKGLEGIKKLTGMFEAECFIVITGLKGGISRPIILETGRDLVRLCCSADVARSRLPTKMTENQRDRPRQRERRETGKKERPASRVLFAQHVYLI